MAALNDLVMPKLGLTMTEGLLVEWLVGPGSRVKPGDPLFVVENDKVASEITAEGAGEIHEILVEQGETIPVGTVVARWTGPGQGGSQSEGSKTASDSVRPSPAAESAAGPAASFPPSGPRVIASPMARRLAREQGVDLTQIRGSGPGGRIKAADVRAMQARATPSEPATDSLKDRTPEGNEQQWPASSLIQAMARRMVEAKQRVPHFYLTAEAEVSELLSLRRRLNEEPGYPRLTVNHFILAAVAHALTRVPKQNRIWREGEIVEFGAVDLGMAVSTEKGLLAPVLRDLGRRSLDEIALLAAAMTGKARAGKVAADDMTGGAMTVSNAGMYGVTYMTPIINPPQSAILGVGKVRGVFRPDADGKPVLKQEMGLVLACDHRLHDGAGAARFLNQVIALLQNPQAVLRGPGGWQGG